MFTRNGKGLTAKGVKPKCPFQHRFKNTYLFGAFSPVTGYKFILDLPECNSNTFQIFLNEFAKENITELKILFLDNGAFHKAKKLTIPQNIVLFFLPPYSPELNPAEKVWWTLKRELNLLTFNTLEKLQLKIYDLINSELPVKKIISLTSYDLFLFSLQTILYV